MPATQAPAPRAPAPSETVQTMHIFKERQIAAPIDIVFETLLRPVGPMADLKAKLEPWPGGRWFRDLGNNTGHLWGHVQVIKPPTLLEICGPFVMSYPVSGFIQYRLAEKDGGTILAMTHRAVGLLAKEHIEGMTKGWGDILEKIGAAAEAKSR